MLHHIFVYGTLKTGQCREQCWPVKPVEICKAIVQGKLYDTGPYPAMVEGDNWVAGEVWSYRQCDLGPVLEVLDEIEGYNQPGQKNDYNRKLVDVQLQSGQWRQASVYIYARHELLRFHRLLEPQQPWEGKLLAVWPPGGDW